MPANTNPASIKGVIPFALMATSDPTGTIAAVTYPNGTREVVRGETINWALKRGYKVVWSDASS